jgi:hypothetical protein
MSIKNLERAFDERIGEINNQLSLNLIDVKTYENEKNFAKFALDRLKLEETYRVFDKNFGKDNLPKYEHDKDLYDTMLIFIRYSNKAVAEIAERHGISVEEVISVAEFRINQLNKRLGKD